MTDRRKAALPSGRLVAWYGDDFTGSAAVMEVLAFAGIETVLFLDIPGPAQLKRFASSQAIGIAGTARSHGLAWLEEHLPPIFDFLAGLEAKVTHYKVCSTLDSSPAIGSIGKAIDLAAGVFDGGWIPFLVAAPPIRRYQCFGNLFAAAPDGVHRLDRHPVMASHPVTPMNEADVARHLSRQTERNIGILDVENLEDPDAARSGLAQIRQQGAEVVCLDTVTGKNLEVCGDLIWSGGRGRLLAVGSQGVEYALVAHWQASGLLPVIEPPGGAGVVDRIIVVSGSVSAVTASQIDHAAAKGFEPVLLNAGDIVRGGGRAEMAVADAYRLASDALRKGLSPLIVTARGPDDPAVSAFRDAVAETGAMFEAANNRIGEVLGLLLARLIAETDVRRVVISGGDTSGHAMRQLGLYALTALAPTVPGAALFRAHSNDPRFDEIEIALKGGQMGTPDYFEWIRRGGGAARAERKLA